MDALADSYADGHQIAVHTWSHPYLTSLTNAEIVAELLWTRQIIYDILGVEPAYMRPPYGDIDNRVRYICNMLGFKVVIWDFDTEDWMIDNGLTAESVISGFESNVTNVFMASSATTGFITLEHEMYNYTVAAAEPMLTFGIQAGLKPMSVAQCVGDSDPCKYFKTETNL